MLFLKYVPILQSINSVESLLTVCWSIFIFYFQKIRTAQTIYFKR